MKRKDTAFSITEMAIVITIIAILTGIVIASNRTSSSAKIATARSLTKSSPVADNESLVAWFETTIAASFIYSETEDNSSISTWYDLGPNRIHTYQATPANKPLYIADGANNLPIIRFDGSADFLASTNNLGMPANPDFTIFVVGNVSGGGSAAPWINSGAASTGNSISFGKYSTDDGKVFMGFFGSDLYYSNSNNTNIKIHCWTRSGSGNDQTGNSIYVNGALQSITNVGGAITPNITNAILRIGSNGTTFINSDIAEIIIFSRALNDLERKDVEKYLGKKWGITVS